MCNSIALPILEPSQTGDARRKVTSFASRLGFNEVDQGKASIIVTEIANNLVNHARVGQLVIRSLSENGAVGLEILALDQGPGISDINECLRDGFSTIGTAGNGLGAIQRLSHRFEIYSDVETGTAILSQLWADSLPRSQPRLEVGIVCLPIAGEAVSGDAWASQFLDDRYLLMVADGLGHGPQAAEASLAAVRILQENGHRPPPEILAAAHASLRSTRGAAVAITELNLQTEAVCYAGVGNISGCLVSGDRSTSMVSYNGTVGHEVRKINSFSYSWMRGGLLIMHSDGLRTQWRLDRYPGLFTKHPSLIAGILYRDFNRGRDDVTVLVAREATR